MVNTDTVTIPYEMYTDLVWRAAAYNAIMSHRREGKLDDVVFETLIKEEEKQKEERNSDK